MTRLLRVLFFPFLLIGCVEAAVPTFQYSDGHNSYTLLGRDPAQGGTTTIPTVLIPVSLTFEGSKVSREPAELNATPDVPKIVRSPIFTPFAVPNDKATQFADAMLRATFPNAPDWHTIFGAPEVMPAVHIVVPPESGYILTSKRTGGSVAVLDVEFVQRELFKQVPSRPGKLLIAVTRNATYYTEGDATLCCSWGTHGTDSSTGDSFVLASYLDGAPAVVEEQDVQPLTQQLAEFINDPLHDPLVRERRENTPGNRYPAWLRPAGMRPGDQGRCGGTHVASAYFLLQPTDTNRKNNFPESQPFIVHAGNAVYHVENVALLHWYIGDSENLGHTDSFPDVHALTEPAKPCPDWNQRPRATEIGAQPTTTPIMPRNAPNGHQLIGYWTAYDAAGSLFPLTQVSAQWDVVIVAFASPGKNSEGTLRFQPPAGVTADRFKSDIDLLKRRGKKVMISLGGGGEYFSLADRNHLPNFVSSVARIVEEYGFDGIDLDFESPSLLLDPGDTDFRRPTTPSIVNLIAGLRQLRHDLGPGFMISLVPEGPQLPAGYRAYGGQFGSYLPLAYGLRDILSFMDVQDYNTPPLEGLDGEIYQAGSIDYHAAMTELVLHGFNAAGDPNHFFPPLPAARVAAGFLIGETNPAVVGQAMNYLITGAKPLGATYRLLKPSGYRGMIGAMFWTIDADRLGNYEFSNVIGPQLHSFTAY